MKSKVTSIRGAFKVLDALLNAEEKERFRRQSADEFAADQHFGLGLWVRNTWIYGADESTCRALFGDEFSLPDSASSQFLMRYHKHLCETKCQ